MSTSFSLCELDVELFIEEIHKLPAIWDSASEEYRDKYMKRAAWVTLCETVCENFNDKSDQEKNDIGIMLMRKWKHLRDCFIRSLKKNEKSAVAGRPTKQYIYARKLAFLLNSEEVTTAAHSSIEGSVPTIYIEGSIEETILPTTTTVAVTTNTVTSQKLPTLNAAKRLQKSTPLQQPAKRQKHSETMVTDQVRTVTPTTSSAVHEVVDDDKAFFDSIMSTIKTFNIDQKLDFRTEVLKLLRKIRMSDQQQPSVLPPLYHYPSYYTHNVTSQNQFIAASPFHSVQQSQNCSPASSTPPQISQSDSHRTPNPESQPDSPASSCEDSKESIDLFTLY